MVGDQRRGRRQAEEPRTREGVGVGVLRAVLVSAAWVTGLTSPQSPYPGVARTHAPIISLLRSYSPSRLLVLHSGIEDSRPWISESRENTTTEPSLLDLFLFILFYLFVIFFDQPKTLRVICCWMSRFLYRWTLIGVCMCVCIKGNTGLNIDTHLHTSPKDQGWINVQKGQEMRDLEDRFPNHIILLFLHLFIIFFFIFDMDYFFCRIN